MRTVLSKERSQRMSMKNRGKEAGQGPNAISSLLDSGTIVLTESAVVERLRRLEPRLIDHQLAHARAIYSDQGRRLISGLHRQYLDIGSRLDVPMLVFTDTWRANKERLQNAGMAGMDVNGDCTRFLRNIVQGYGTYATNVVLAGLMGSRGDAYKPEEALSARDAASFHAFQAESLTRAGVDLLIAATMPSVSEAAGMAAAMSLSGLPYVISFVLNGKGRILDGATIRKAIEAIDGTAARKPLFYMVNCCHPTFYAAAMKELKQDDGVLLERIIGLQANTSRKEAGEREGLAVLDTEDPETFAEAMLNIRREFGARILGGCCGTDDRHLAALAKRCKEPGREANIRKEGT